MRTQLLEKRGGIVVVLLSLFLVIFTTSVSASPFPPETDLEDGLEAEFATRRIENIHRGLYEDTLNDGNNDWAGPDDEFDIDDSTFFIRDAAERDLFDSAHANGDGGGIDGATKNSLLNRYGARALISFEDAQNDITLSKRHNWVLVCYDADPKSANAKPLQPRTRYCSRQYSYVCNNMGLRSFRIRNTVCDRRCKCVNLGYGFDCKLDLYVAHMKKCISRRGFESYDTIPADAMDESDFHKLGTRRDVTTDTQHFSRAERDSRSLTRRHNWALACYDMDPHDFPEEATLDTEASRKCLSAGFSCDGRGYLITTKKTDGWIDPYTNCLTICKCENLYPKSKIQSGIRLHLAVKGGVDRFVSRSRDLESPGISSDLVGIDGAVFSDTPEPATSPLEVRSDMSQQNTTAEDEGDSMKTISSSQNVTATSPSSKLHIGYYLNCQQPLMTVRCMFEVGGYTCDHHGNLYSIWYDSSPKVKGVADWIQPDWRTCNCVCECFFNTGKRDLQDRGLPAPTPEEAVEHFGSYNLECDNEKLTEACTGSRHFCDHRGRLKGEMNTAPNTTCASSCQCINTKADDKAVIINAMRAVSEKPRAPTVELRSDIHISPKAKRALSPGHYPNASWTMKCEAYGDNSWHAATKHCEIELHVGCSAEGALYGEAGQVPDQGCIDHCRCRREGPEASPHADLKTLPSNHSGLIWQSMIPKASKGKYAMHCEAFSKMTAEQSTRECAVADHLRCSEKGILFTPDNEPIDESCAAHCRCDWHPADGNQFNVRAMPPLFKPNAEFKPTRHGTPVEPRQPQDNPIILNKNKINECSALLNGVPTWTLMCQLVPPDYQGMTSYCYLLGTWCPYNGPKLSFGRNSSLADKKTCSEACICYRRYNPKPSPAPPKPKRAAESIDSNGADHGSTSTFAPLMPPPPNHDPNTWTVFDPQETTMATVTASKK